MNQSTHEDLMGIGSQFHPNTQLATPNTNQITSTNIANALTNMTHHPSTAKPADPAEKKNAGPGPQQAFQSAEAYSAIERWYNEPSSQEPWNGLRTANGK